MCLVFSQAEALCRIKLLDFPQAEMCRQAKEVLVLKRVNGKLLVVGCRFGEELPMCTNVRLRAPDVGG